MRKFISTMLATILLLNGAVILTNQSAQETELALVVFQSDRDGNNEICVMNADGENQRRLTVKAWAAAPTWSPDSQKIAYHAIWRGGPTVFVMDSDGNNQQKMRDNKFKAFDSSPAWSPIGQKIAFVSTRDGNKEIYVMDADGERPRRLTGNKLVDDYPAWSPDGQNIAFVSRRDGNFEIYVTRTAGGGGRLG